MKRKILSILLIIFMLSASLITIPVNAKILQDEDDNWEWDYSYEWTDSATYVTLEDYLSAHYVGYSSLDKSQITTLYILCEYVHEGAVYTYTIEDLSGLYEFPNLKQLRIDDNRYATTQAAIESLDFSKLTNLEKLYLSDVDISNLEIDELINLTYLQIGWSAPATALEIEDYKDLDLDLTKMEKLNHFEYWVDFPPELDEDRRFAMMEEILVVPPQGYELNYTFPDDGSWIDFYLKSLVILDLSTDKTNYAKYENVVCTVSWDQNMQVAEYHLSFDSSKLELIDASIDDDYYYVLDGTIYVNWAAFDEVDLKEMSFTFNAVNEGSAVFDVYPYEFATGDLDNIFSYATTANAYNYTITITGYIKDDAQIQNDFTNIDGEDFNLISGFRLTDNKVTFQDLLDLDAFAEGVTAKAYKNGSEILATEGLGTGSKIRLYKGEELVREFDVIVYGDVSGDGEITTLDALTLIRAINDKLPYDYDFSTIHWAAGQVFTGHQDVHGPSAIDALAIIKHLNEKYEITQNY